MSAGRHHHFPRFGKRKQAKLPTAGRHEVESRAALRWALPFAASVERDLGAGAVVVAEPMFGYAGRRVRLTLHHGGRSVVVQVDERYARGDHAASRVAKAWRVGAS